MKRWIKSKKRLPEPFKEVLVHTYKGEYDVAYLENISSEDKEYRWARDDMGMFHYDLDEVTDWTPIPKLNEEEEE